MKLLSLCILCIGFLSCAETKKNKSLDPINWTDRTIPLDDRNDLALESTYLSVYSYIYQLDDTRVSTLTATISMRNISSTDSVFVAKGDYYNTSGQLIRSYFDKPIYIKPLETVEIVIDENDRAGGAGGNFIFEWMTPGKNDPLFEAVMISTLSQQGLSFITQGIKR